MKKLLFIVTLASLSNTLFAQSSLQLNNFWDNTYYINPSTINEKYYIEMSIAARQQWVGFNGAPTTGFGSATIYDEDLHSQFGLRLAADNIGYTYTSNVLITYAHSIILSGDIHLHLGLGMSLQSYAYDQSRITLDDQNDNVPYSRLINKSDFNGDFGFELASKTWHFGASTHNMMNMYDELTGKASNGTTQVPLGSVHLGTTTNYIYFNYKEEFRKYVNYGAGICGIHYYDPYNGTSLVQIQANAMAYFKITPAARVFNIGAYIRAGQGVADIPSTEIGGIFGVDLGDNLYLVYSVDTNISDISHNTVGTHELMLTYKINPRRKCRTCGF
jgi:type IX secretion system PorP/SprF family membrane protein